MLLIGKYSPPLFPPHFLPACRLSTATFTYLTYSVNFCPFFSILLLPFATICELENRNGKLVDNYMLNNSIQSLP